MAEIHPTELIGYAEARSNVVFFSPSDPGFLKIGGQDRAAFLQRQTTNDVSLLSEQKSLQTVLTNPNARILDVFRLVVLDAETIGAITLPGRGSKTARYLKSRIFFMDKVTLEDASQSITQIELHGPASANLLEHLGLRQPPSLDEVIQGRLGQVVVKLIGEVGFSGPGYRLLTSTGNKDALLTALESSQAIQLSPDTYQVLRVEAGLPSADFELTEEYTPLEAGLGSAISGQKGCYTGQEVIARQITYDKVTQRLVGLRLQSPAAGKERVWVDGRSIGVITSHAVSPTFGPIALAILRRPHHQVGTRVIIGVDGEGEENPAVVAELPFGLNHQT